MAIGAHDATVVPLSPTDLTPRQALADAMVAPLSRTPCYVSFSGGRDSSSVLAMARTVARQHQLDDPIPVTLRFPGIARPRSHAGRSR